MAADVEQFVMAEGTENPWWGVGNTIDPKAGMQVWIEQGGLDWRVVEMPLLIQGKRENRTAEGWKALVRSTDARLLGCVSEDYKVHQNRDLVEVFRGFCESGELAIDTMGSLQGGRKVFASAKVNGAVVIKTPKGDDIHQLYFLLSTGHTGGYATQADLTEVRTVCHNTLTMARTAAASQDTRWKMSHLGRWTSQHAADVKALVDRALGRAGTLKEEWERLYAAPADRAVEALFFTEMYQPDLYDKVVEKTADLMTIGGHTVRTPSMTRSREQARLVTLDSIVGDMDMRQEVLQSLLNPDRFNRTVTTLMNTAVRQPGGGMSAGTVADPVNTVTYWTDHDRGRNRESALDSAMFGVGRNEKAAAMDLGLEYAAAMERVVGRTGGR